MARTLAAAVLMLWSTACWAHGGYGAMFIGEHNSTTPTDRGSAADYAETSSRQSALGEEAPPPPAPAPAQDQEASDPAPLPRQAPAVEPAPVTPREQQRGARAPRPAPARIGGFVRRDPAAQRYYEQPAQERLSDAVADQPRRQPEGGRAYKLWNTVSAPVAMTAAQVARTPGVDDAEAAAGAEYERRILGRAASAGGPSLAAAGAAPEMPAAFGAGASASPASAGAKPAAGEVFVSVDLAASEKTGLKDAVAGLTSATGFRPDPRFPPQTSQLHAPDAAAREAANLRGWMPADKLNAAVTAAGVLRVQVDHAGPRPESASSAVTSLIVGLRIPAQASAGETFKRTISELSSSARFRWTRTVGFQAIPNSKDVALVVVGELPLSRIPRLLEHPGVLKVAPAPLEPQAAEPPAGPRSRAAEFLSYARQKAPLLVVLTLLLLLRPVAGVVLKLGQAFVPYER